MPPEKNRANVTSEARAQTRVMTVSPSANRLNAPRLARHAVRVSGTITSPPRSRRRLMS